MSDSTPWKNMAPSAPAPSESGTKRDYGNMLNEKVKTKIKKKRGSAWELVKKLKLT